MIIRDCLELKKTKRRPVWIMRQAGRYLNSYRELRKKYSFDDFAHQPELATQVTLLPIQQYELDAAVVFSDILYPLKSMGVDLQFTEQGPVLSSPKTLEEFKKLKFEFDPETHTPSILKTISLVRKELSLEKAVMGFCGAPFTMLSYLMEGKLTKDLGIVKRWIYEHPTEMKKTLSYLADAMGRYLEAQVEAGADVVQMFDTWASVLDEKDFEEFALPYAREVISQVTVPCVYYMNGVSHLLPQLNSVGAQAISVDWRISLAEARAQLSPVTAIQGNLDPYHLLLSPDQLRERVFKMCSSYGTSPGHIVNLGHGIVPVIPEDRVKVFIDAVHEWSEQSL